MSATSAVQLKRGGAVHESVSGTPKCNPWQSVAKFKRVDAPVTCRRCLSGRYDTTGPKALAELLRL